MRQPPANAIHRITTGSPASAGLGHGIPRDLQRCCDGSKADATGAHHPHPPITVSNPGDPLEQEADHIADQVMRKPAAPSHLQPTASTVHGSGSYIEQTAGGATTSVDHALAGPSRQLEPDLRQDMEQRFGDDYSQVRVHTGTIAEQSAHDVQAEAHTVGHDIVFGAGCYAPASTAGRWLLAHELAHTIQQPQGVSRRPYGPGRDWGSIPIDCDAISDPVEREELMQRDYERYRWKDALDWLHKGELGDADLSYSPLMNRLTGLKNSEVSALIGKIQAFQAQRDKEHEGQHGTDFVNHLTTTLLPASLKGGINGNMTPARFSKRLDYVRAITKGSCESTAQSGFSQDAFLKTLQGKAGGIKSCRTHP